MNKPFLPLLLIILSYPTSTLAVDSRYHGFDLRNAIIPIEQILSGGPGKDGIPAIDEPVFLPVVQAGHIQPTDRVLGLNYRGISKAYPIKILNWHEIVNDDFNGEAVVVTFCPLCNSGIAYSAIIDGKMLQFSVSGLLYNSDVLLYDRESESLWSQLMNQAISGPMRGKRLTPLPLTHTTWEDWRQRYPRTLVLSRDTGVLRDYDTNPYQDYKLDRSIWFPVANTDNRYHAKELVMGIELNGLSKAYPFTELLKMPAVFQDSLAGKSLTIKFDRQHETANIYGPDQQEIATVISFWFAWYAFHPQTIIFTAE